MAETEGSFNVMEAGRNKIRIALADDHPLLRQALRNVLEKEPDFEIIAEVDDGEQAITIAQRLSPQVFVMDISLPKLSGLEATRQIKAKCKGVAVLVLTVHDDSEHILAVLEAGADGYLTKSVFGHEVVQAVRAVAAGETVLSSSVSQQVIKHALHHVAKSVPSDSQEKITSRELEILRLTASGLGNKEIASRLGLSPPTVKSYLAEIFLKLNAQSRTEAVINALRVGILTIDDVN